MLSKQSQNYLNDIKNRIKKRQGKINIITTHPIPETYKLVFLSGSPSCIINAKELQGKNTEGSIVHLNGSNYKVIKRLFISSTVLELHLDNVLP
ncbi:TPA: hypothetical protein SLZ57_000732 [Vibrio cholerae]|uniref:hypothetical protein n=3 Tax=Vibrio cholerae TaxID=666 RepID=UPI0005B629FC|nr:hypothetical protein [Vibrio cholerae]EJB8417216.1 hypothetical protein [Vibrio vulnificus]MDF4617795.1 hypothetical protein [Vibrio parahaemolyticus]EGR0773574.1 hypothetical protein [Vibrio cholerae]EGR0778072.1 hypothetical protein [Vibrio cholerae]EGR0780493.1 hypothetical protein [Vibrio cholerae]